MSDALDVMSIQSQLSRIDTKVSIVEGQVGAMDAKLDVTYNELLALKEDFNVMMQQQHARLIMNNANTELIKVRQELQKRFGKYNDVRLDMLGILQATDSMLVHKKTISRITEEVMIEVPEYWLAPCLVALAAWINNDKNLAQRAIKEAVKRDEEKTALVMALICRRNNRVAAAHQWLAVYFSHQKVADFTQDTFVFLDAYVNGIFGEDKYHVCEDYVKSWRADIEKSLGDESNKHNQQWINYFKTYEKSDIENYPNIVDNCLEADYIDGYLSSIASAKILHETFEELDQAEIDKDVLRSNIDQKLIDLVNTYEKEEERLLQKERLQEYILYYNGDERRAKSKVISEEKARQHKALGAIDRMYSLIISDSYKDISTKKTALAFLKDDINKNYTDYMQEKKNNFPSQITLTIDDWSCVYDGNADVLKQSYQQYLAGLHDEKISKLKAQRESVLHTVYILSALAVFGCFVNIAVCLFFICFAAVRYMKYRGYEEKYSEVDEEFNKRYYEGCKTINDTVLEWENIVGRTQEWNNKPILRLVS